MTGTNFKNPFLEYSEALQGAHIEEEFQKFCGAFGTYQRIIILGNGGSNSVASHISQDYMKFHKKKVSILSDPSMLTMLTNDFGYENAYQKFLEYYVENDTLVIIMSSGGESKNMLRAQEMQLILFGITILIAPIMVLLSVCIKSFCTE